MFDGKWLSKTFVDLLDYWRLGNRQITNKLDTISRALGIGGKPDGISGKDFAGLYLNPATKQQAIDYLLGDLDMTWNFACRVGLNGSGQANKPTNQSARVLVAKQ